MKFLFYCISSLLLFVSCSKNTDSNDDYYIRFTANSERIDMGVQGDVLSAVLSKKSNMGLYSITMTGTRGVPNGMTVLMESVVIIVQDNDPIQVNKNYEMHDAVLANGVPIARNMFTYVDRDKKVFNATLLRTNNIQTSNECSVRFTEINENSIRGVFTATLIDPANQTTVLPITEGEFYLHLQRQ